MTDGVCSEDKRDTVTSSPSLPGQNLISPDLSEVDPNTIQVSSPLAYNHTLQSPPSDIAEADHPDVQVEPSSPFIFSPVGRHQLLRIPPTSPPIQTVDSRTRAAMVSPRSPMPPPVIFAGLPDRSPASSLPSGSQRCNDLLNNDVSPRESLSDSWAHSQTKQQRLRKAPKSRQRATDSFKGPRRRRKIVAQRRKRSSLREGASRLNEVDPEADCRTDFEGSDVVVDVEEQQEGLQRAIEYDDESGDSGDIDMTNFPPLNDALDSKSKSRGVGAGRRDLSYSPHTASQSVYSRLKSLSSVKAYQDQSSHSAPHAVECRPAPGRSKEQNELEAALEHAKGHEVTLRQSLALLQGQVREALEKLEDKQLAFEALEKEHRELKSSFRDLMATAINQAEDQSNDRRPLGSGKGDTSPHDDGAEENAGSSATPRFTSSASSSAASLSAVRHQVADAMDDGPSGAVDSLVTMGSSWTEKTSVGLAMPASGGSTRVSSTVQSPTMSADCLLSGEKDVNSLNEASVAFSNDESRLAGSEFFGSVLNEKRKLQEELDEARRLLLDLESERQQLRGGREAEGKPISGEEEGGLDDASPNATSAKVTQSTFTTASLIRKFTNRRRTINGSLLHRSDVSSEEHRRLKEERDDLLGRLNKTEELYNVLRGTNEHAQQVLRRNSVLEARCAELEAEKDSQLQALHEELQRARASNHNTDVALLRMKADLESKNVEVADLHSDLRELHAKYRQQREGAAETAKLKSTIDQLSDALAAEKLKLSQAQSQWQAERGHLQKELSNLSRLPDCLTSQSTDEALLARLAHLESLCSATKADAHSRATALEAKAATLSMELSAAQASAEAARRESGRHSERAAELEEQLNLARSKVDTLKALEQKVLNLETRLAEADLKRSELSDQLRIEKGVVRSQALQVERHTSTIASTSERLRTLLDRNAALEHLLQQHFKEKEKLLSQNNREDRRLSLQADLLRTRWESATKRISALEHELHTAEEKWRTALKEAADHAAHDLRTLRTSFEAQKSKLLQKHAADLAACREQQEKEVEDFKMKREDRLNEVVQRYETHIKQLRDVHEKRLADSLQAHERGRERLIAEHHSAMSSITAKLQQQCEHERNGYGKKLEDVISQYKQKIRHFMDKQTAEKNSLKSALNEAKVDAEKLQLQVDLSEEKLIEMKKHFQEEMAKFVKETQSNFDTRLSHETAKLAEAQARLIATRDLEIQRLSSRHEEELTAARNAASPSKTRFADLQKRNTQLAQSVEAAQRAHRAALEENSAEIAKLEARHNDALNEMRKLGEGREAELRLTIKKLEAASVKSAPELENDVAKLRETIGLLESSKAEMQEMYQQEITLLREQLAAKKDILKTLSAMTQERESLIQQNAQLDLTHQSIQKNFTDELKEKCRALSELQTSNVKLERRISVLEIALTDREEQIARLQRSLHSVKEHSSDSTGGSTPGKDCDIAALQTRCLGLQEALESEKARRKDLQETETRHLQSLNELSTKLEEAAKQKHELQELIEQMAADVSRNAELSLAVSLVTTKLETANAELSSLQSRLALKDRRIEELVAQLDDVHNAARSPRSLEEVVSAQHALESKVAMMTSRCRELEETKLTLEQDRRAREHRMEMEKQMLSAHIEQRDRQLKQLIGTNERVARLLERNGELEGVVLDLTNQIEDLRAQLQRAQTGNSHFESSESCVERNSSLVTTTSHRHSQNGHRHSEEQTALKRMSLDLSSYQAQLEEKEREIAGLNETVRKLRAEFAEEVQSFKEKIRMATIESTLMSSSASDDDLMAQLARLLERVTELQEEVSRIKLEKQGHTRSLEREIEILREIAHEKREHSEKPLSPRNSGSPDPSLLRERLSHQRLVNSMSANTNQEIAELMALQRRNADLQLTIDRLNKLVEDQQLTLNALNQRAGAAIRQNSDLGYIAEQLHGILGEGSSLEAIIKRNVELERLLQQATSEAAARVAHASDGSRSSPHPADGAEDTYTATAVSAAAKSDAAEMRAKQRRYSGEEPAGRPVYRHKNIYESTATTAISIVSPMASVGQLSKECSPSSAETICGTCGRPLVSTFKSILTMTSTQNQGAAERSAFHPAVKSTIGPTHSKNYLSSPAIRLFDSRPSRIITLSPAAETSTTTTPSTTFVPSGSTSQSSRPSPHSSPNFDPLLSDLQSRRLLHKKGTLDVVGSGSALIEKETEGAEISGTVVDDGDTPRQRLDGLSSSRSSTSSNDKSSNASDSEQHRSEESFYRGDKGDQYEKTKGAVGTHSMLHWGGVGSMRDSLGQLLSDSSDTGDDGAEDQPWVAPTVEAQERRGSATPCSSGENVAVDKIEKVVENAVQQSNDRHSSMADGDVILEETSSRQAPVRQASKERPSHALNRRDKESESKESPLARRGRWSRLSVPWGGTSKSPAARASESNQTIARRGGRHRNAKSLNRPVIGSVQFGSAGDTTSSQLGERPVSRATVGKSVSTGALAAAAASGGVSASGPLTLAPQQQKHRTWRAKRPRTAREESGGSSDGLEEVRRCD